MHNHPFLKIYQYDKKITQRKSHTLSADSKGKTVFDSKFISRNRQLIKNQRSRNHNLSEDIKLLFSRMFNDSSPKRTPRLMQTNISFNTGCSETQTPLSHRKLFTRSYEKSLNKLQKGLATSRPLQRKKNTSSKKFCPQSLVQPCKINSMNLQSRNETPRVKKLKNNALVIGKNRQNIRRRNISNHISQIQCSNWAEDTTPWHVDRQLDSPMLRETENNIRSSYYSQFSQFP